MDPDLAERPEKGKQPRTLFKHEGSGPFVEEDSHSTQHLYESLAWSEDAFEDCSASAHFVHGKPLS